MIWHARFVFNVIRKKSGKKMLSIKNLHVCVEDKKILTGLNLEILPGTVHAIMGPNGAGKSTLGNILSGRSGYTITEGSIEFCGQNLLDLSPTERALAGLFLAFQYPIEIPGVSNVYMLKAALNAKRKIHGLPEVDAMEFLKLVKDKINQVDLDQDFLYRAVNEGFSGGEKKRNELLQMMILEPKLAVLDETDSGLDIDALKIVADGVNSLRSNDRSFIVVTHYQRLLDYIIPDFVHVLVGGKIVKSGDKNLALQLEQQGYAWLEQGA
jgi:Fe-S cluster assembly ATP-binding protein